MPIPSIISPFSLPIAIVFFLSPLEQMAQKQKHPFTNEQKEVLIEFVKEHPCLYKLSDPMYKETEMKNRLWQEIAQKLKIESNFRILSCC